MKKLLLFCTFIINVLFMNAQLDNQCATPDGNTTDTPGAYSYAVDTASLQNFTPVVFNVFFWGINKDDGTSPYPLTETAALSAIAKLNIQYNPFNIFFKYYGMDFFNSDKYHIIDYSELYPPADNIFEYARDNNYKKPDAFNIYVPYSTNGYSGAAEKRKKTSVVVNGFSMINSYSLLNHEIGHCLDMLHTHVNWGNNACEHVERDPFHSDYNAHYRGDNITDTAAVPDFQREHYWELRGLGLSHAEAEALYIPYKYVDANFNYIGSGGDCLNPSNPYQIAPKDVKNIMAYGPTAPAFAKKFTTGQKVKMHEAIENDELGEFGPRKTTFASLYEPYKGSYPTYYPHPLPWQLPLFQPGFTYDFVECCCDYYQPAIYDDSNFTIDPNHVVKHIDPLEISYSNIYHPNHTAIIIEEIDLALGTSQAQKCYDNNYTPQILSGRVIKFNDNIFNSNVTITPKDSTEITDPNLIPELDNGLYKIETNYENGIDEETVIYKTGT